MFRAAVSIGARLPFMVITLAIAVPSGIKIFNWIATMWGGAIELKAPMLFAIGFVTMFVIGGRQRGSHSSLRFPLPPEGPYLALAPPPLVLLCAPILAVFARVSFLVCRPSHSCDHPT